MMSVFGQNRPVYLKTYGRRKRKMEQWFSPDLRKKAFSFSSTPSSDQSFPETTCPKKGKKKTTADNKTKQTALEELESDEENVNPESAPRNKTGSKRTKKTAVTKKQKVGKHEPATQHTSRVRRKKQQIFSSSETEDDSVFITKKKQSSAFPQRASDKVEDGERESAAPLPLSRFVTHRRRAPPNQHKKHPSKQKFGVINSILNSSEDFMVPPFTNRGTRHKPPTVLKKSCRENSSAKRAASFADNSHVRSFSALREVSFNDSVEKMMSCKPPLLSSTPSVVSRRNLRYLEPSVSEISSCSCDELDNPTVKTTSSSALQMRPQQFSTQRSKHTQKIETTKETEECAESTHQPKTLESFNKCKERINDEADQEEGRNVYEQEAEACESGQTSASVIFVSAQTHLGSKVEELKERCRSSSAVVLLEEVDISDILSKKSYIKKLQVKGACLPSLKEPSTSADAVEISDGIQFQPISDHSVSHTHSKLLCLTSSTSSTSSLSVPPLSTPSTCEFSDSVQALIDRLKVECLSSCLTVSLQRLEHKLLSKVQQVSMESLKTQSDSLPSPETKSDDKGLKSVIYSQKFKNSQKDPQSQREGKTAGVVRRLSDSFGIPTISPASFVVPGRANLQVPLKERAGISTGRKACVSGLSVSRWSKKDMDEQNKRHMKNDMKTRTKPGDCSLNYLLPANKNPHAGESVCGWSPGTSNIGLPVTPLRAEQLNLSSLLANFSPGMRITQSWRRLKAALSIHKKTIAFLTPKRLCLSNLKPLDGMDTSLDLFGTPMVTYTPSSKVTSHLLRSMTNTSMTSDDEDISDAEKVYHECQQDGPLTFDDCIPLEQMKRCAKIGEGTFGEVFSTISGSGQTVALKIIPVEGSQKVNGEPQKTFGEILHEIIISKELSSLNSKETNKTSGFIGLNNLHCVQGCYPQSLLKAWDKFDREKGSENDRPDFFSKEQFFVILEFEFGGSDLENMNGKLFSMAQAKSVLHQVTAALAVAEQALSFEHRDLHWGNILVKTTKEKNNNFLLNDTAYSIETRGVHVNIIDYSLSRLEIDGLTVSCDISNDKELFMGQGDYQFEIYRLMKKENNNCWGEYNPHSNVLWLHYLVDKLLTMKYKTKSKTNQQKALKGSLKSFQSEILNYGSATDALMKCSLFQ
ncbi:uncharacterized protein haspin isoform X2 [Hoplias malabaricus]|uniref:uncharacterized protein haspin isoform X2 n=1 Tax=Hoplias malabaricus TaxID=27720 RepID=UPI003463563F